MSYFLWPKNAWHVMACQKPCVLIPPGGSAVSIAWIKLVRVSMFNFFGPKRVPFLVWVCTRFFWESIAGHLKHQKRIK